MSVDNYEVRNRYGDVVQRGDLERLGAERPDEARWRVHALLMLNDGRETSCFLRSGDSASFAVSITTGDAHDLVSGGV